MSIQVEALSQRNRNRREWIPMNKNLDDQPKSGMVLSQPCDWSVGASYRLSVNIRSNSKETKNEK